MGRFLSALMVVLSGATVAGAQSSPFPPPITLDSSRPDPSVEREGTSVWEMLPYELTRDAERLVRITSQDKKRHERIRKDVGLKMVKIFSAPSCASKRYVVDVSDEDCLSGADLIRTSFYSLARGLYGESLADVRIIGQELRAGNEGLHHGMIMDLGPISPSAFDSKGMELTAVSGIETARSFEEEVSIRERLKAGFEVGGKRVSSSMTITRGHTYLVRLVNYSFKSGSRSIFQRDVIYLLHLAELNRDRTALFLWKKLRDKPAPRL